jgi:hypothetical protein
MNPFSVYPQDFGSQKTSNNKYDGCPPIMADARHFTDYRPNCHVENMVRMQHGVQNSHEYRMLLTHKAKEIMNLNRSYACMKNCCGPCKEPYEQGTMLPEQSMVKCNDKSCSVDWVNQQGLGQGRQYHEKSALEMSCGDWNRQYNDKQGVERAHNAYPEPKPFNIGRCR